MPISHEDQALLNESNGQKGSSNRVLMTSVADEV